MKYERFFLENYKGIRKRLEFSPNIGIKVPHCIIGDNESGKTTILKGIELISQLCEGEKIDDDIRKAIKPKGSYFSDAVKLGASLSCPKRIIDHEELGKYLDLDNSDTIDMSLEFSYQFKKASFVNDSDKIEIHFGGSLVTEEEDQEAIFGLICEHAPDVIYYDDFKFAVPSTIRFIEDNKQANAQTHLNSDTNKHWQKIFTDILKGQDMEDAGTFQTDVVDWHLDSNNDPRIAGDRLRNMGRYLSTILEEWIPSDRNNIERFEISRKEPEQEADKMFSDYQIEIVSGNNSYQMNERSKGLQWSFCFHILTRIRKNRNSEGFIFLLDEPASNLHIRPQNEMLNHLNELCDDDSAVIYSTHSPALIGTDNECYKHTFIAKNISQELQETNINLYKLVEVDKNVEIQDIEPILAKLSYEDIKLLSGSKAKEKNERAEWRAVADSIKLIIDSIQDKATLPTVARISGVLNFLINVIKLPGGP